MRTPMIGRKMVTLGVLIGCFLGAGSANHYHQHAMTVMAQQAQTGQMLFRSLCETCHGRNGNGSGGAPALGESVLATYPTFESLNGYIQSDMPSTAPGTLTTEEARDLTRFIITLNQ